MSDDINEAVMRSVIFNMRVLLTDSQNEAALAGINALAAFIKEMGLPASFREMGITDDSILGYIADSTNITAGCCKKLSKVEIHEILKECF